MLSSNHDGTNDDDTGEGEGGGEVNDAEPGFVRGKSMIFTATLSPKLAERDESRLNEMIRCERKRLNRKAMAAAVLEEGTAPIMVQESFSSRSGKTLHLAFNCARSNDLLYSHPYASGFPQTTLSAAKNRTTLETESSGVLDTDTVGSTGNRTQTQASFWRLFTDNRTNEQNRIGPRPILAVAGNNTTENPADNHRSDNNNSNNSNNSNKSNNGTWRG